MKEQKLRMLADEGAAWGVKLLFLWPNLKFRHIYNMRVHSFMNEVSVLVTVNKKGRRKDWNVQQTFPYPEAC